MSLTFSKEWLVVANEALDLIGEAPLQSLESDSAKNESLNIELPAAVKAVLSSHQFKCATRRTVLSPDADNVPAWGYKYCYNLPQNFISIVSVKDAEYKLESQHILSDEAPLYFIYIECPKDPYYLSTAVLEAIKLELAYKMAHIATVNPQLLNRLREDKAIALALARRDDNNGLQQEDTSLKWWGDMR